MKKIYAISFLINLFINSVQSAESYVSAQQDVHKKVVSSGLGTIERTSFLMKSSKVNFLFKNKEGINQFDKSLIDYSIVLARKDEDLRKDVLLSQLFLDPKANKYTYIREFFNINKLLIDGCLKNDLNQVAFAIFYQADHNASDQDGNTPLHIASMYGNEIIVKKLLDAGADINKPNMYGDTVFDNPITLSMKTLLRSFADKEAAFNLQVANAFK